MWSNNTAFQVVVVTIVIVKMVDPPNVLDALKPDCADKIRTNGHPTNMCYFTTMIILL